MSDKITAPSTQMETDASVKTFNYQMEFLKLEYHAINETIGRIDETAAKVKNWAIITWAGSLTFALGHSELRRHIWVTALPPIIFFFVDAWWRRIQRMFIFRTERISDFLNDDRLGQSFRQQKLIDFRVLDPRGKQHRNTEEFRSFTSVWRTIRFRELAAMYLGISAISVGLWWILNR